MQVIAIAQEFVILAIYMYIYTMTKRQNLIILIGNMNQ